MKNKKIAELKASNPVVGEVRPVKRTAKVVEVPKVQDVVGISLKYIGVYKRLDNKKQVVALINDVSMFGNKGRIKND